MSRRALGWLGLLTLAAVVLVPACFIEVHAANAFIFAEHELLIQFYVEVLVIFAAIVGGLAAVVGFVCAVVYFWELAHE